MSNMLIVKYLTARYNEQCEKFPLTRDSVTLEGYIKANYQMAVRNLAKFPRLSKLFYQHEELVARGQVQPVAEEI